MKLRHTTTSGDDKIELQMTPMIDIVFQLLVFFIMTFKIVSQEGDFNIKMPLAAPAAGQPDELQVETMRVRLEADGAGKLVRMSLNDRALTFLESKNGQIHMKQLQDEIVALIGTDRGPGSIQENAEVELDCDFGLNYVHVIEAITAVSGYVGDDDIVIKLIEKIKFAPPRPVAGG
jgi:biopolymer transport protein ExbD